MTMQPDDLKALRQKAEMTQQAFADAMGMSRKAINEMEAGKAPIEMRTAKAARRVSDRFVVRDTNDGRYMVIRRTLREVANPKAIASYQNTSRLYGVFTQRAHAYRWLAALQASNVAPRPATARFEG